MKTRPAAIDELQAASAVGQGKLYRVYDELLRERAVTSAQVLLTIGDLSARTHYLNARQTLRKLLDWQVVAVVNENDTTATDEISFGDNDFLAAQVAMLVGADLLVLLTDIDGLYSADPRLDEHAQLVERVTDFEALQELEIGHTTSPLGSGGMRSKVVAADMATAAGVATVICNGLREGALQAVLGGRREGTMFMARETGHSSFKLWLKYAKPAHGTLLIDEGAARALREGNASLLPVGIVGVEGEFDAGDAVEIAVAREPALAADDREGHLQLLGAGAGEVTRDETEAVRGDPAASRPRRRCTAITSVGRTSPVVPLDDGDDHNPGGGHLRPGQARGESAGAGGHRDEERRARGDRGGAGGARRGDPRGERARYAGRA